DALAAQPVRDLIRAGRQLAERPPRLGSVLLDDPQGVPLTGLDGHAVEPVQRPVERLELRPAEAAVRLLVVLAVVEQEVARGPRLRGRRAHLEPRAGHRPMIAQVWREPRRAGARWAPTDAAGGRSRSCASASSCCCSIAGARVLWRG